MTHSAELIILATTKVGEKSLVLHTLSPDWGRRSFICSVSGASRTSLFLPLSILEAEITENPKSDLWRARAFCPAHSLNGLRENLYKNAITMFMSEVLYRTIKDGANEQGLYEWCRNSILTLDALESDFSNYHLRFVLELATVLGFSPSGQDLAPFAGERYQELKDLAALDFGRFMLYPLNGERRNEIAGILLKYLGYHTESSINIRSLSVLREIFR
mgnify:CR=1 FL=1